MYRLDNIFFARFFNAKTSGGTVKTGFYQSLNISQYSPDLDILGEIVGANIDLYLYNEYSQRYVTGTWARYMTWDKENKRYNIDLDFYNDFPAALCANILNAESFYQITQLDLSDVLETISKTKDIGARSKTRTKGNDTIQSGARHDSSAINTGAQSTTVTDTIGSRSDSTQTVYGAESETNDTENKKYAFDSAAYSNDTKSTTTNNTTSHTDNTTITNGQQQNSSTTAAGARADGTTTDIGEQTTTKTYGNEGESDAAARDSELITRHISADPEKLLKIKEHLAKINAYKLIGDAIAATMLRKDWG